MYSKRVKFFKKFFKRKVTVLEYGDYDVFTNSIDFDPCYFLGLKDKERNLDTLFKMANDYDERKTLIFDNEEICFYIDFIKSDELFYPRVKQYKSAYFYRNGNDYYLVTAGIDD